MKAKVNVELDISDEFDLLRKYITPQSGETFGESLDLLQKICDKAFALGRLFQSEYCVPNFEITDEEKLK